MARQVTLGIKIEVNGQQKVIKSIQELETEIEQLTQDIKGLDFGSEEFEKASKNLGKLKASLRDVDKQVEGVDREQLFDGFTGAINGVTGAFLIASSAARTFGADAETVEAIQKREQAALEAVNIALGLQALAEAYAKREKILALAVKARDIIATNLNTAAQTAYTVAVGASTGALRAFRIALATTGVGALIVGIGYLVSKFIEAKAATEEVKEEVKSLSEFQIEAAKSAAQERMSIEVLVGVLDNQNASLDTKREAYEELKKLIPDLEGLTYDQALAEGVLADAIERQITLINLRAKATAIEQFLVEQEKRRLALEQERKEAEKLTKPIEKLLELQQEYTRAQAGGFAGTLDEYIEQQRQYGRELGNVNDETEEAITLEEELLNIQTEIFELTSQQNKNIKKRTDATKENTEAQDKANKAFEEYLSLLEDFTEVGTASVKVLADGEEIIRKQVGLLERRNAVLNASVKEQEDFKKSLDEIIGVIKIPDADAAELRDKFAEIFEQTLMGGAQSAKSYQDALNKIFDSLRDEEGTLKALTDVIGEESLQALVEYFDTQVQIEETLLKQLDTVGDLNVVTATINAIQQRGLQTGQTQREIQEDIYNTVAFGLFPSIKSVTDLTDDQKKIVEATIPSLVAQSNIFAQILDVNTQLEKLTGKIGKNIKIQEQGISDIQFDNLLNFIKANEDNVDKISEYFSNISTETSNLTQEQIDQINNLLKSIKLDDFRDELLDTLADVVQVFSDISSRISGIASAQNSLLLEQLAYSEEVTLAKIGDATEEAQAEQEKARQEFAKKRFEVEKQSRITELGFSVADAIANSAAAIINTLASVPGPAGIALSTVIGAITAAELATIKAQLNFVKGTQFVGRRGGLLVGPSHEMNGINMGGLQLEGGEAVINRSAVSQFSDILSQISTSTGGRPLVGDDSRIVEEIRRTNQRPIKAYVLDQDIQDTRKINSRLEQISRL